jgi:antirestriction protein ArdC
VELFVTALEIGEVVRMLRHYSVFRASQIDGIPEYRPPHVEEAPWIRPEAADLILKNSGAVIHTGGDRAFYSPQTDCPYKSTRTQPTCCSPSCWPAI